jgi:uncharacterized protein (DUF58 family)
VSRRAIAPPTLVGAATLVLSAGVALISLRASNPWLLLVACALFTPVLVSQLLRAHLTAISICYNSPQRMAVGESVEQSFHAHNHGRRSSPAFRLTHSHHGFGSLSLAVPSLPPGGMARLEIQRTAVNRGVQARHELMLQTTAPFGMATYRRLMAGDNQTSVYPAPGPVAELSGIAQGDRLSGRPSRFGHELHGLREWRPGDALNQVHWRATARHDRLTVVVPEILVSSRFALVVAGSSADEDWEALLSTAAWTAVEAARAHSPIRLSAAGAPEHLGVDAVGVLDWFAGLGDVAEGTEAQLRAAAEWAEPDGLVVIAGTRAFAPELRPAVQRAVILHPDGGLLEW